MVQNNSDKLIFGETNDNKRFQNRNNDSHRFNENISLFS